MNGFCVLAQPRTDQAAPTDVRILVFICPIHFPHDEIQAAQHRNDIAHLVPTQQLREHLQVHKGRPAKLRAPGALAAIADEVDAQFALAALDGKVGLPAWWTQGHRRAGADGTGRQVLDRDAAETYTFLNFLHAHDVACVAIAFLSYLDLHRHFAVRHVGAVDRQVPGNATGPCHGSSEAKGDGLLRIEMPART